MLCEAKKREKLEDPNNGVEGGRAGPGDEDMGVLWRPKRAQIK